MNRKKLWSADGRVNRMELILPVWPGWTQPDNRPLVLTKRIFMIFGLFVARQSEFRVLCASVALLPFRSVEKSDHSPACIDIQTGIGSNVTEELPFFPFCIL